MSAPLRSGGGITQESLEAVLWYYITHDATSIYADPTPLAPRADQMVLATRKLFWNGLYHLSYSTILEALLNTQERALAMGILSRDYPWSKIPL